MSLGNPMDLRRLRCESGQATVEAAWLAATFLLAAFGLGWKLVSLLVEAWLDRREAVLLPVLSLWP